MGKEYTMPDGSIAHHNPEYIKQISHLGKDRQTSYLSFYENFKVVSNIKVGSQTTTQFVWRQGIHILHIYFTNHATGLNIINNGSFYQDVLLRNHMMKFWTKIDVGTFLSERMISSMIYLLPLSEN